MLYLFYLVLFWGPRASSTSSPSVVESVAAFWQLPCSLQNGVRFLPHSPARGTALASCKTLAFSHWAAPPRKLDLTAVPLFEARRLPGILPKPLAWLPHAKIRKRTGKNIYKPTRLIGRDVVARGEGGAALKT